MDDSIDSELFEILRHLAIVSAALIHNPANREELLARREALVRAACAFGFFISDDQQQQLLERLSASSRVQRSKSATRNHEDILAWALSHDAVPAEVHRPFFDHQPTALRFLSGAAKGGTPELKAITWEDFFARFDLMGLALVFDDAAGYEFVVDPRPDSTEIPFTRG